MRNENKKVIRVHVSSDFAGRNSVDLLTICHTSQSITVQVFFSVMMGSMALGQAGPQFAVLGTAMGAAGSLYQIIDRVSLLRHCH